MFRDNNWVFYIALLLCVATAIIMRTKKIEYSLLDATSDKKLKRENIIYFITFALMGYIVFWAAIRNGYIDTRAYIESYVRTKTEFSFSNLFANDEEKAPLYKLFQIILKRLGFNWQGYLASVAIISGGCMAYGIGKYSDDVTLSIYLFISGMHFTWLLNGIRQFLAASIIFATMHLIVKKKFWKFMLLIFVLYFVHKTALIMIPIYFIVHLKTWSWGIYACVLATMALVILFPNQFVMLLDDSFEEYNVAEQIANDDGVNILRFLVAMVTPTLAFIYKKQIAEYDNKYINMMVNMSLITAGIFAVGVVTSGIYIGRLPLYSDLFGIILLPFILKRVLPNELKGLIFVFCIVLYLIFFYLQMSNGFYYTTNVFKSMDLGGAQL